MGLSINNVSMNYFLRGVDAVDKKTDSNLPGADKGNVANDAKVGRNKLLDETCAMVSKLDQWPQGGSGRRNCHGINIDGCPSLLTRDELDAKIS